MIRLAAGGSLTGSEEGHPVQQRALCIFITNMVVGTEIGWAVLRQEAKKGVLFDSFPPVLQLQLKRFEYDYTRDTMVKVRLLA
jgi:hypothetical protein